MIIDSETNHLFVADCLPIKFPKFYSEFETCLRKSNAQFSFLPCTKDIWARDYMPIQVDENYFVQFVYAPDYLKSNYWKKKISDANSICNELKIFTIKSDLIVDGGNIVKSKNKIIVCDKIFLENKNLSRNKIISELVNQLRVEQVIIIPSHPNDENGHADGLIRFIDDKTVLINELKSEAKSFRDEFKKSIRESGLNSIEIPYNPFNNKTDLDATGIYINYLQMKEKIFIPVFKKREDEYALKRFSEIFFDSEIIPVYSNDIGRKGGLLNCISWNTL